MVAERGGRVQQGVEEGEWQTAGVAEAEWDCR